MSNLIEIIFNEPIKEFDNFRLIKDFITAQDFIILYKKISHEDEKIDILQSLNNILSNDLSTINICILNNSNRFIKQKKTINDYEIENISEMNDSIQTEKNIFINWLISEYFINTNEKICQYLYEIFAKVIQIIGCDRHILEIIYNSLTKIYFYNDDKKIQLATLSENLSLLNQHMKILLIAYGCQDNNILNKASKPYNYYCLKEYESFLIEPFISNCNKSKLHEGFTIYICFKYLLSPKYNKKNQSNIFLITFNNNHKLNMFIDSNLNLILKIIDNRNRSENKVIICDKTKINEWMNISISFNTIKKNKKFPLVIIINNKLINEVKEIESSASNISEINNVFLFGDFVGLFTSFILFNKYLDNNALINYQKYFEKGLYKFKHFNNFIKNTDNFLQNLIVLIIPMLQPDSRNIINLANNDTNISNSFKIRYIENKKNENNDKMNLINININYNMSKKISLLGGVENILPFFEIIFKLIKNKNNNNASPKKNINNKNNQDFIYLQSCLAKIFRIINSVLIEQKKNVEELSKINFFEIISLFLENLELSSPKNEIFSQEILTLFLNLGTFLYYNQSKYLSISKIYINCILLNVKIIHKFSLANQRKLFSKIFELIQNNNRNNLNNIIIDEKNLILIIQYYNEYYQNFFCCEKHANFYGENKKFMDLEKLFDIITKIIGESIKYDEGNFEDTFIKILNFLSIQSKPCLVRCLISNIFISFLSRENLKQSVKNKCIKFLLNNNIILFLLTIYAYPDIISEIITLFSRLSQYSKISEMDFFNSKNIKYIGNSVLPIYIRLKDYDNISTDYNSELTCIINSENKNIKVTNTKINDNFLRRKRSVSQKGSNKNLGIYNDLADDEELMTNFLIESYHKNFSNEKIKFDKKYSDDFLFKNSSRLKLFDEDPIKRKISFNEEDEKQSCITPAFKERNLSSVEVPISFAKYTNSQKSKPPTKKVNLELEYEKAKKEYNSMLPLLDLLSEEQLSSFIQTILESLLNWLRINTNKYVLEIITIFFNYEKIQYSHINKFVEILDTIINEQKKTKTDNNNNSNNITLINFNFYFWAIQTIFQFYLIKNNKADLLKMKYKSNDGNGSIVDNIINKGIKTLVDLIINIKKDDSYVLTVLNDFLLCGTKIKNEFGLNKINIPYLNNFYREILITLLKEYQKYHSLNHSEEIILIINTCYEFMFFFNIEEQNKEMQNFILNDNQIFNGIILSGINSNTPSPQTNNKNNNINNQISKIWDDYPLFQKIISIMNISKSVDSTNYKDDKELEENILNHKNSDTFQEQISFLCKENSELPIIYIISNLYIITFHLVQNKEEKIKILNDYKQYIIFLILASSNLSYNPSVTNNIQDKVILTLNYFIGFIYERCYNDANKELLIPCLNEVFILMLKVVKRANDQSQKNKSTKIIKKIISIAAAQKKIDFSKCAVPKIFSSDNMQKVFTKDLVSTFKKTGFKDFDDKKYLLSLLENCIDLTSIKKEVKNMFGIAQFLAKGQKRIQEMKTKTKDKIKNEANPTFYDINFFKTRSQISMSMEKTLLIVDEEIKVYKENKIIEDLQRKEFYKKIKKNIFGFSGLWSNKAIFYNKNNNENQFLLKYKLINHYGIIPFRPILLPIYDINAYLPKFSLFDKENLFINKDKMKKSIISVINLNMEQIFNNCRCNNDAIGCMYENNKESNDYIIEDIYQSIFPKVYNYQINKICPNFFTDKLAEPPYSGLLFIGNSCCFVTQMSHIKGFFKLSEKNCSFIQNIYGDDYKNNINKIYNKKNSLDIKDKEEDYDPEKQTCYGSYVKLNSNKFVYIDIKYKSIKYIFLRKYYYKDSALEIFTSRNKVYFFNFPDSFSRQRILDSLLNKLSSKKEIKIQKNKIVGYDMTSNSTNNDLLTNIIENWQDWKISTFELLLWLNIFGNRSYNDISQYPVFPWVITQYEDCFTLEDQKYSNSKSPSEGKSGSNKGKNTGTFVKSNSSEVTAFPLIKSNEIIDIKNDDNKYNKKFVISSNNVKEYEETYNDIDLCDDKTIDLQKDIRDFSLPMGMMDFNEQSEKRKNNYISKYTMMKNEKDSKDSKNNANSNNKLYIYGSHYSNPVYVCHYLTRIFPYSSISIELQGDKFDDPNRLLISVYKSFEGATSHESDVRELLPEFYYLPQIFVNENNLDLKIKLSNNITNNEKNNNNKENNNGNHNNVILPKWSQGNPYIFVTKLKIFLESEEVNAKINKWFDLIFGYKQKGKEAENAFNLFLPSSYDFFDIKAEANTYDSKQCFLRLAEFGLTPHQIINKKFPKRKPKDNKKKTLLESWKENKLKLKIFTNKKSNNIKENNSNNDGLNIKKIKYIDDENVIVISDNYKYTKYEIIQFIMASNIRLDSHTKHYLKKDQITRLNYENDYKKYNPNSPIIVYEKGSYIAQGGFYDGKIIISQISTKNKSKASSNHESAIAIKEVYNPMDPSPIVALIINQNETVILSGSFIGSVVIYKKKNWKKKCQINDHLNLPITSLFFNDNLNIWGSACKDGYVNLYTYPNNQKITSIKMDSEALYADYLFIISSPLPSFIVFSKNNSCFYSFSLLGKEIGKEIEESEKICPPTIFKDSSFNESLVYGNNSGNILLRFLPSLNLFSSIDINGNNIDCVEVSKNGRYCTSWSNESEEFYIVFDPSLISENEELLILHFANDLDE